MLSTLGKSIAGPPQFFQFARSAPHRRNKTIVPEMNPSRRLLLDEHSNSSHYNSDTIITCINNSISLTTVSYPIFRFTKETTFFISVMLGVILLTE